MTKTKPFDRVHYAFDAPDAAMQAGTGRRMWKPRLPRLNARRVAFASMAFVVTLLASIVFVGIVALRALEPREGEWSMRVGPWEHPVSVPVLLRWATHPLALPLLDGHSLRTRAGTWHVRAHAGGSIDATCEPCVLRLRELGPVPLVLERVVLHARRAGPEAFAGTLELGSSTTSDPVSIAWDAKLRRDGLAWTARLEPTPVTALLATLREGTVPEARRARIDGTFAFDAAFVVNAQGITGAKVRPQVEGLFVEGLETDALVSAAPPAACKSTSRGRIDGWLPRAVIAAEDQRFFEHGGFDLDEATHAWIGNRERGGAARGASTITQQLAKLIYTGDDRSAARKLREWLYAVEMERTLGKGRILQLYLAMAPWGGSVCGGEAAARRWLGKAANRLEPHEAAWLASLLRAPDAQLARWRDTAAIDTGRVARVIDGLRPMPRWQREQHIEQLERWQPAVRGVPSSPSPAAPV